MDTSLVVRDAAGAIINIGPWDYQMEPVMVPDPETPIRDDKNEIVGYAQKQAGERARNPLPEGAYESEANIVTSGDGGLYATENYRGLRVGGYPPIGDQLDALYKAGVFPQEMAEQIAAVKLKYPKANG